MMNFDFWPSSSYETFRPASDQLLLVAHSSRFLMYSGIIGVLGGLALFFLWQSPPDNIGKKTGLTVMLIGFLMLGISVPHGRMDFNRTRGTVIIDRMYWYGGTSHYELPLSDVQGAVIRTSRNDELFYLKVKNQGRFALKGYDSSTGQTEAADVVNAWLGIPVLN